MHNLEHLLFIASLRIRKETGNHRLADHVLALASASHNFDPCVMGDGRTANEHLSEWNSAWSQKYAWLLRGAS